MTETAIPQPNIQPMLDDLSQLTPSQLADYHLAVTALQLDGNEVFLSDTIRTEADELIDRTHHDLLVASGDALTKEFVPDAGPLVVTYVHIDI